MAKHIFVLGFPWSLGGANTECWHTVKLWRLCGYDVTLVPTWQANKEYAEKLRSVGAKIHETSKEQLNKVPHLRESVVVAFCNSQLWPVYGALKQLKCRVVWVNCMTFMYQQERDAAREHGVCDAYVFQSLFQRGELEPMLLELGYKEHQGHLIRGAFDISEFQFAPNRDMMNFVIGRLARPDWDKWHPDMWRIIEAVEHPKRKALVMGWNEKLDARVGKPPAWAKALKHSEIPSQQFIGQCHAMLCLNGGAKENWPRVGLEAMAAGCPIVAERRWGWLEMIDHGVSGYLADTPDQCADYLNALARRPQLREAIAEEARLRCEVLSNPNDIAYGWAVLFDSIGGLPSV